MSYCREEGKDKIIFVTESDHTQPSTVALPDIEDDAEYEGLIKANGEINWECPCLGGMATGVCGEQFRNAFSCFHTSQSEPKGSECIEQFRTMQECFKNYPEIYGEFENVDEEEKDDKELFNGESDKEMDGEIGEEMVGRKEIGEVNGEKMDGEKGRKVQGTSSKDSKEAEQKSGSKKRTVKSS